MKKLFIIFIVMSNSFAYSNDESTTTHESVLSPDESLKHAMHAQHHVEFEKSKERYMSDYEKRIANLTQLKACASMTHNEKDLSVCKAQRDERDEKIKLDWAKKE